MTSAADDLPAENKEMFEAGFEPADAIASAWDAVKKLMADAPASAMFDDLTILLEPGRSIIADTGVCLTTVRNKKNRPVVGTKSAIRDPRSAIDTWLLTDAGFNILLSMETYKWYYHLISADRAAEPHTFPYKVAGPLCDGGDVYFDIEGEGRLPDHRLLPENVQPGEILALLDSGAYTLSQASQYNARFLPAVVLIDTAGKPQLIRRRDTFEDLVNTDIF